MNGQGTLKILPLYVWPKGLAVNFNPILHGLFQAGFTRGGGGGGSVAQSARGLFSEMVKATTIKLGTLINEDNTNLLYS